MSNSAHFAAQQFQAARTSGARESAQAHPFISAPDRRTVLKWLGTLPILAEQGCRNFVQPASGVTLVLMDESWLNGAFQSGRRDELDQFTKETGIRVEPAPAPEGAVEQLEMCRRLLESGARIPDVYSIDVIWPGILGENLLDLAPYVPSAEVAAHFPELIANNTVSGKLVALPFLLDIGMLFYRTDLLCRYGYANPPESWQELADMADKMQSGERARGHKNFWGFIWQGASSEALTCNALEWQASEGGGEILGKDTITVDNPLAARAWARAARWIEAISPPGVSAYRELDGYNVWQAGQAAFMRNWSTSYLAATAAPDQSSLARNMFDIALLPRGEKGIAATVGGQGYGVSRHSRYPREASMLVRFLCRPDTQLRRSELIRAAPTIPELYKNSTLLAKDGYFSTVLRAYQRSGVLRPSTAAGKKYPLVSRAFSEEVHAVLDRRKPATQAVSELESQLAQIIGLKQPRGI